MITLFRNIHCNKILQKMKLIAPLFLHFSLLNIRVVRLKNKKSNVSNNNNKDIPFLATFHTISFSKKCVSVYDLRSLHKQFRK